MHNARAGPHASLLVLQEKPVKFNRNRDETMVVIGELATSVCRFDRNTNDNWNANWNNLANSNANGRMAQLNQDNLMETNLYSKIYDFNNLFRAWQKARKGKTKKGYVIKFEKDLERNLLDLQLELKSETYRPLQLETFILRDPKTRRIAKSDFRDRVIHHALVNILEPIFEKSFIHDSCANRIGKGTLYALKRFEKFRRKVTKNFTSQAFCLKADIKHYFQEVNQEILLHLIKRKISDVKALNLVQKINTNFGAQRERE